MTVLWAEGFSNQTGAADILAGGVLNSITGSFALFGSPSPAGGRVVTLTSTALGVSAWAGKVVTPTTQGYTHNGIQMPVIAPGDGAIMWWAFYDIEASACQISVTLDCATGTVAVYSGFAPYTFAATGAGTLLGTSAAGVVAPLSYTDIEFGLKVDPAAGFVTVMINGSAVSGCSVVGAITQLTADNYFQEVLYGITVSAGTNSYTAVFGDFYIGDNTGSAFNGFIGPGTIYTQFATANDGVQFTPLSGANWQEISETQMDGFTSYNASTTAGNQDLFSSSGTIPAGYEPLFLKLQNASIATAGTENVINVLSSSGTISNGATVTVGTAAFAYSDTYYLTDPGTGAAWSAGNPDAAQVAAWGYKKV